MARKIFGYRFNWLTVRGTQGTDTVCTDCLRDAETLAVYGFDRSLPVYETEDAECSVCNGTVESPTDLNAEPFWELT